jgi:DNA invertase Pin-like site-specific DNA recombinase
MYIAYYRVSTQRQGQSGLGLEAQKSAVKAFIKDAQLISEFTEVESGTKKYRPQLIKALALAKEKKAILVIAKLDRLARNLHFISGLIESGVQFVAADMPEADRTWLQMAAVFGEWEARKISERTKSALQAAKARGTVLGSPSPENGSKAGLIVIKAKSEAYANSVEPVLQSVVARVGKNLRAVAAELQLRGIKTARGNDVWYPSQVAQLLRKTNHA